jgi:hypothetical protein
MIPPEVRHLSALLPGRLPMEVVENYLGNLEAGEPELALEELYGDLELQELAISAEQAAALVAAAAAMDITRFTAADVGRLPRL